MKVEAIERNQDVIVVDLFIALSRLSAEAETETFLIDLLSATELKRLARRFRIAVLIAAGFTFEEINAELGVSTTLVTKVRRWYFEQGEGFRMGIEKLAEVGRLEESVGDRSGARLLELGQRDARRYAPYGDAFWPTEIVDAVCAGMKRAKEKNGPNQ